MSFSVVDKRGAGSRVSGGTNGDEAALKQQEAPPWFPVFVEVEGERQRQLLKWGDQRGQHIDGAVGHPHFQTMAEEYKRQNDSREADGKVGDWSKIWLEEVFEALAESDLDKLDYELTQAIAVAVAWKEDLAWRKVHAA